MNYRFAKIFKNSAYLLVTNISTLVALFGFSVLIARSLGKEALGLYTLFTALLMPLTFFIDFGQSTSLVQEIGRAPNEAPRILQSTFFLKALLILPTALAVAGIVCFYLDETNTRLWFLVLVAILLPRATYAAFEAALRAQQRMRELMAIAIISSGVLLAGTWLLLRWHYTFAYLLAWLVTVETLKAGLIAFRFRQGTGAALSFRNTPSDRQFTLALARRSLPFFALGIVGILHDRLDVVLLAAMREVGEVGVYGAANNFVKVLRLAPSVIVAAFFPAISALGKDTERLHRLSHQTLGLQLSVSLVLASGVFLLADKLIVLTYGFEAAVPVLRIAVWAIVPLALYSTLIYVFFNANRGAWNLGIVGVAVIVNLAANYLLIPHYGAVALAWSNLFSESFCCLLYFIFYAKLSRAHQAAFDRDELPAHSTIAERSYA